MSQSLNINDVSTEFSSSIAMTPQLFFCVLCTKSFAKEISRNRHVGYCQKKDRRQYSREKACSICNKAKIKCDFGYPCSTCTTKGLACVNSSSVRSGYGRASDRLVEKRNYTKSSAAQLANVPMVLPTSYGMYDRPTNAEMHLDFSQDESKIQGMFLSSGLAFQTDGMSYINDFAATTTNNNSFTLCSPSEPYHPDVESSIQLFPNESRDFTPRYYPGEEPRSHFTRNSISSFSPMPSVSQLEDDTAIPASLQKALPIARSQIVLIASILRTYPKMILRRITLPPFIHAVSYAQVETAINNPFPEPLETCISIAHMFVAKTNESSRFLWQTIDAERQRLIKEMYLFSREETLAAIQAMVIYVIMRMADKGATEHDSELDMYTMGKLLEWFKQHCPGPFSTNDFEGGRPCWRQWIFEETRRRTAIVCFLGSLVAYGRAIPDFRSIPLCCNKGLWEAISQETWEEEYNISLRNLKERQLGSLGDLMNMHHIVSDGSPGNTNGLDEWNAGLDGLSMLLTIATQPM